jgi:hypothetical protein
MMLLHPAVMNIALAELMATLRCPFPVLGTVPYAMDVISADGSRVESSGDAPSLLSS